VIGVEHLVGDEAWHGVPPLLLAYVWLERPAAKWFAWAFAN
jgi:hypothetical protein